ncbi:MAG: protein kinase [Micrococcales bacterium]|nr:protein kinase [Micrococcales bacterium]MCL2667528.1 protein kinase [Micrococcales bacterium]
MLTGDTLSQWLQRRVGTVVCGPSVRLSPSGLLRVSDRTDSHQVRIGLPVVHGGQAAVARVAVDGATHALALRVQAVASPAERARQMERLVNMATVTQAAHKNPAAYPAVLGVLESFVVTVPGDEMAIASPDTRYELWCDVMAWCPSTLDDHRQRMGPASQAPALVVAQMAPLVATVHAVHRDLQVLHRDITPSNVLVDENGRLLLADWGVAHTIATDQTSTRTELVGNRGFCLPPEALAGDKAVGRYTDAWYLGAMTVWMLTDQTPGPHQGPAWMPPGLPGGRAGLALDEVLQGLCRPDPRQRMDLADAAARLHRLTSATPADWIGPPPPRPSVTPQASGSVPAQPVAPAPVAPAPTTTRRRRRTITAVVAAATAVVAAVVAAVVWVSTRPDGPEATTDTVTCWTTVEGDCPAFDIIAISYSVFKGETGDGTLAQCYQSALDIKPGTFVTCMWPDRNVAVLISLFDDIDTMENHYLGRAGATKSTDAPRFVNGPDGPVFTIELEEGTTYIYCFAELPMCLEAAGNETYPVTMTTRLFHAISPEEAHQIAEYLDKTRQG